MNNASYIFADSFYTVCFAIIYRKNFTCFVDPKTDSCIISLLSQLDLEKRIVTCADDCYDEKRKLNTALMDDIDYDAVYEKLNALIDKSKGWLKEALIGTMEDKNLIMRLKARND